MSVSRRKAIGIRTDSPLLACFPNQMAAEGTVISLRTPVAAALSRNLALDCRFAIALADDFSCNSPPRISLDPQTGVPYRFHLYPSSLQKRFHEVIRRLEIPKRVSIHSLRHSFATHLQTTMAYTHVATKNKMGVTSPLEGL